MTSLLRRIIIVMHECIKTNMILRDLHYAINHLDIRKGNVFLKLQRNYYFIEPSRIEQMSQVWSHEISSFSHARDDDLGRAHGPQGPGILGQLCPPTWASEVLGPSALLPSLNRLAVCGCRL